MVKIQQPYRIKGEIHAGPKRPEVILTDEARQQAEKSVQRHSTRQQIALRSHVISASVNGKTKAQITEKLGLLCKPPSCGEIGG